MVNSSNIEQQLKREVEAMHDFLAAWFRGDEKSDVERFRAELIDRFSPDLRMIYPSGQVLTREDMFDPIFSAHGSNPPFRVAIRNFELVSLSDNKDLATACYIEDQFNAKNTVPADNSRVSTVVFRLAGARRAIEWVHIHETALD